nr:putative ribonuclease H-like domain-containing protein [Tanacetum cinerariifolium]
MPQKPDLVFHTAPIAVETDHLAITVQLSTAKPAQDLSHTTRPLAPIIKDCVSNSEDEFEPNDPQSVPSFVQTSEHVKTPRHFVQPVEAPILTATPKPTSPKTNRSGKRKNRKTCFVCRSVDHLIKDCNFHAKPKPQPTPRNYAHRGYNKQNASFTQKHPQKHIVPTAVLTKSKPVYVTAVRPVSADVPKIMMTRPKHAHSIDTESKLTFRRKITRSKSPKTSNSPPRVTAAQASVVSAAKGKKGKWGNPQYALKDKGVIDTGCSRHMTGNMSYLSDFQELNGGYVAFGGNPKGGKILGKGKIKTGKLDFEDVYFVKELKFNLFSVSQMCDKKNKALFSNTECLVLSPDFKLPDKSQVLLRVPRENNMYNVNLKDIVPSGDLTCLFAKATIDESNLWHRRLRHINLKTINKLVKDNLVRGLPIKVFENNNTCVTCKKGKQHRASCKTKPVSSVNQPLFRLHMDLFGPTFVKSLNKKSYCLVITDDYSRFTWVFFLATKDETSPILKTFVTCLENQLSLKVKVIRSDNGTEFKNSDFNQFCGLKGIKREFSVPRTPQQNGIAERKNMTLIEAARTMLADSLLPILFWAEAVNTACYVQNRVLVTKPHNKTHYELLHGRTPSIGFMRPFGCPVTILNTLDPDAVFLDHNC